MTVTSRKVSFGDACLVMRVESQVLSSAELDVHKPVGLRLVQESVGYHFSVYRMRRFCSYGFAGFDG